jgi:hypothetical protein
VTRTNQYLGRDYCQRGPKLVQTPVTLNFIALFNERTVGSYSGTSKSVGPRAAAPGVAATVTVKSHSPWYRRIQTYTCRQAQARARDKSESHSRNSPRERAREKARKCQCTVTKPDAMAARKSIANSAFARSGGASRDLARTAALATGLKWPIMAFARSTIP